ncbi:MAG: hypothetical protein M1829_002274 [Trizodia sp. TS-e1964]|nr:MAG: hypothetical protein M1829_002274 [Trizodia sp. TS-e1964]
MTAWLRPSRKNLLRYIEPRRAQCRRYLSVQSTLPPSLLNRARSIASEHAKLSKELAQEFDPQIAKRLGPLLAVNKIFQQWESAHSGIEELKSLLQDSSTDEELRALAAADLVESTAQLSTISQELTAALVPKHPFENLPCMIEIRPGAGGGEAALFAGDLLRMYQAYCSRKGLRSSLLKYEDEEGSSQNNSSHISLHEAVLEIEQPGAYNTLRCEAGVHRVQRVPATESKGRTHTSAATVMVLPSFPSNGTDESELNIDDPSNDYYIDPKDVRTDIMRARGAGGQHVNTTDSAVRLTHLPTNTVVSMQDYRSQPKNREKAWHLLRSRLAQARREAREEETVKLRRSIVGVARMGRGDKVRTYNWGQQRVTDHRSGCSVHNLDDVVQGGESLDVIMESVRAWLGERDLEALIAEEEEKEQKGGSTAKTKGR